MATVDGRIALSRAERLLDPSAGMVWKRLWPADADEMIGRRSAWIERHHHPSVVLEGSGTFVSDDAGTLDLPAVDGTGASAEDLWADFLPHQRLDGLRWSTVVAG